MPFRLVVNLLPTLLPELAIARPTAGSVTKLADIFDGFLLVPKRKKNHQVKMRERYGCDNWRFGTKLWKPKRSITTCPECGSFHEYHTICRECFKKMDGSAENQKRALSESQKTRSWFEPNVVQPKNPASSDSPTIIKEN